jgi:hypothetical protein
MSDTGTEPPSDSRMLREPSGQPPDQRLRRSSASPVGPFVRQAGWLSVAAGALFLLAQTVMWTFDQRLNLETSQDPVFIAAKIVYLAGFIVLMFALIAINGLRLMVCRRRRPAGWA